MTTVCTSCLIAETGYTDGASYPLSTSPQAPEPVYCVGGVPVVTPHKSVLGPSEATLEGAGIALTSTWSSFTTPSPLTTSSLNLSNDQVRDIDVMLVLTGVFTLTGGASGIPVDIRVKYGFTINVTFPSASYTASRQLIIPSASTTVGPIPLSFSLALHDHVPVAAGNTITVDPVLQLKTSGDPTGSAISTAEFAVLLWGAPA